MGIHYRTATREELDLAVEWAAGEGWNPGRGDADSFWVTDPDGYVCAELDGEVIATGSVVSYDGHFGFMGFFIVRPELRGKGIGRDFWFWRRDRLLARLRDGAAIGMDGVFDMQPFYASGGFEFSHRNLRMTGAAPPGFVSDDVVPIEDVPFAAVAEFDRRHFGFDRSEFLRGWITPPGGRGVAAVAGGAVVGTGLLRPCRVGYKIGPLFADDSTVAGKVFAALCDGAEGAQVSLDVPEVNADAVALADRAGLTEDFGCARMYHGPAPDLPWNRIYGVTTFELG